MSNEQWLGLISLLLVLVLIGPSVFAANRGKFLPRLALWLGIFVALGAFYHLFGEQVFGDRFTRAAAIRSSEPLPAAASDAPAPDPAVPDSAPHPLHLF